ncbi:unnamed protein product [Scytosiphon promiscuus]
MPPSSSEVAQLSEMSAELSSWKDSNGRRRSEVADTVGKIGRLEKSLEEQVSLTDRHRENLAALSAALEKRVHKTQDLDLKLGHLAKQASDLHFPRLAAARKAVEDHRGGIGMQLPQDVDAGIDRLSLLEARKCECNRLEELARNEPTENRAREDEAKELASRAEELHELAEADRKDRAALEASRSSSAQVIQHVRSELPLVEQRTKATEESIEHFKRESAELRARIEEAERSDQVHAVLHNTQKDSLSAEAQTLEQSIVQLSVEDPRPAELEAEQATLAQIKEELNAEMEDVDREDKQGGDKVVGMRAQLQEKRQRRTLLVDQKVKDDEVFAAHAINEPEFGDRKAEHQMLSSKIASVRSAQASTGARKAEHEEEMRRVAKESSDKRDAAAKEVSDEEDEQARILSEGKAAAAVVAAKEISVAKKQAERASVEAEVKEVTETLTNLCGMEEEQKSKMAEKDPEHERIVAQTQEMALKLQEEDQAIGRTITKLEAELAQNNAEETADRQRKSEASKHKLFSDTVAWRIQEKTKAIEAARAEEISSYQQEIKVADENFRAAWAEAAGVQGPGSGGIEEYLKEEVRDIEAQMAAEKEEIDATEARIQRLRQNLQP